VFLLRPRDAGWIIDGTVGMGGHAEAMLSATSDATRLLGLDRDPEALRRAGARLAPFGDRVRLAHASFRDVGDVARERGVTSARAILLDLGVSSYQIDESGRGFTFQEDQPLDMRFDPGAEGPAATLLNRLPEEEVARILFEYGEEIHARRIAREIVRRRPLATTGDLVAAVRAAVPRKTWPRFIQAKTAS
jgi:16S rRNA (cytosine1402-N4)-methyltransferase